MKILFKQISIFYCPHQKKIPIILKVYQDLIIIHLINKKKTFKISSSFPLLNKKIRNLKIQILKKVKIKSKQIELFLLNTNLYFLINSKFFIFLHHFFLY